MTAPTKVGFAFATVQGLCSIYTSILMDCRNPGEIESRCLDSSFHSHIGSILERLFRWFSNVHSGPGTRLANASAGGVICWHLGRVSCSSRGHPSNPVQDRSGIPACVAPAESQLTAPASVAAVCNRHAQPKHGGSKDRGDRGQQTRQAPAARSVVWKGHWAQSP